jgi:EAL domain-containing protein (putative c-di-GMP-specific phosphodiesterase class I)
MMKREVLAAEERRCSRINKEELFFNFQPMVDSRFCITGMAAELHHARCNRIINSVKDLLIPPASGTSSALESAWSFAEACSQISRWEKEEEKRDWKLSIAFHLDAVVRNYGIDFLRRILNTSQIDTSKIYLEVDEIASLPRIDCTLINGIKALRSMGVKISVNNFGTEYSSLHRLKEVPVDRITIGGEFIESIFYNKTDQLIFSNIVALAKMLKVEVLIKDISNLEQFEYFAKNQCDMLSGAVLGFRANQQEI